MLYLFYDAPAIDIARHSSGCVISFADDITLLMKSASINGNCENLKHLIDTLNDKWCTPFQQKLEPSKSAVIHFVRGKKTMPEDEVKTALGTIKATSKHRLLGMEIDYKLTFNGHLQNVASKLNRLSGVLRRLGTTSWGMNGSTRLLSIKMAFIPTLTFCSLPSFPYVSKSRLKPICKIYRRLVLWATGAVSTTKHENLLAESAMLSIDDTLTIHTESTWTLWKCFHDRDRSVY
jgi:hypothetical protein